MILGSPVRLLSPIHVLSEENGPLSCSFVPIMSWLSSAGAIDLLQRSHHSKNANPISDPQRCEERQQLYKLSSEVNLNPSSDNNSQFVLYLVVSTCTTNYESLPSIPCLLLIV